MKKVNLKPLAFTKRTIANPKQVSGGYAQQNANQQHQNAPVKEAVTYEYSPCIYYSQIEVNSGCPTSDNGPCPN